MGLPKIQSEDHLWHCLAPRLPNIHVHSPLAGWLSVGLLPFSRRGKWWEMLSKLADLCRTWLVRKLSLATTELMVRMPWRWGSVSQENWYSSSGKISHAKSEDPRFRTFPFSPAPRDISTIFEDQNCRRCSSTESGGGQNYPNFPAVMIFCLDSYRNIQKISKKPMSTLENQGASIFTIHGLRKIRENLHRKPCGQTSPILEDFPQISPAKCRGCQSKLLTPGLARRVRKLLDRPRWKSVKASVGFSGRLSDVSEHFLDQKWGFPKMGVPGYPQIIPNHPKSSILIGFSISHPFSIHRAST